MEAGVSKMQEFQSTMMWSTAKEDFIRLNQNLQALKLFFTA
jgi:hypothetical protein